MCKVRHVIATSGHPTKQVNGHIAQHSPLGLYRDRYGHYKKLCIWKQVTKRCQYTHHCTGGAHGRRTIAGNVFHCQMCNCSTNTTNQVKEKKALRSPPVFQLPPKHPQSQHIKKNVEQKTMRKHVRGNLVGPEFLSTDGPQR